MQMENNERGLGLFGMADDIAIERGIAEFRAARPVVVSDAEEIAIALPVDGLTEATYGAFKRLCAPSKLQLAVTARRARMLGLDVPGPVLIAIAGHDTHESIANLAAGTDCERRPAVGAAGEATCQAIELAKLAQRLPALLVADGADLPPASLAMLIAVRAKAM